MMVARWHIDVRFGYKQTAIDLMRKWMREIGPQVGWTEQNSRLMTGSIGANESAVETEVEVKDLTELNAAWDKLAMIDAHKAWGKEIEPYVVSGTARWEIFRRL